MIHTHTHTNAKYALNFTFIKIMIDIKNIWLHLRNAHIFYEIVTEMEWHAQSYETHSAKVNCIIFNFYLWALWFIHALETRNSNSRFHFQTIENQKPCLTKANSHLQLYLYVPNVLMPLRTLQWHGCLQVGACSLYCQKN